MGSVKPGQWWSAPDAASRRLLYYKCMRTIYGMRAVDALEQTRRMMGELGQQFDLLGAMRTALRG